MTEPVEHNVVDELGVANYIVLRRINDLLMTILNNINPEDADALANLHEQGIFVSPPPAWRPGSESGE